MRGRNSIREDNWIDLDPDGGSSDEAEFDLEKSAREIDNKVSRLINDRAKSSTDSILKRLQRCSGKENEVPNVDADNKDSLKVLKMKGPVNKRVRILTPSKVTVNVMGCKDGNSSSGVVKSMLPKYVDDDTDFQSPVRPYAKNDQVSENLLIGDPKIRESSPQRKRKLLFVGERKSEWKEKNSIAKSEKDETYVHVEGIVKPVQARRRTKKDFDCWLLMRFQPKVFTDVVMSLSPQQRKWVTSTGFGSLLSFCMNEYPHALSHHLVMSFQRQSNSLCFGETNIPITEEDVNEVLGFPRGQNIIHIMRSRHSEDRWRSQYTSAIQGWKVTANMVCEAIKRSGEVDRIFKLNFLVLMSNILLEGPTNPYVRQTMIGFAGDVDNCNQYNWCEYLIRCLRIASIGWLENPGIKYYTGSVAFLVYFYLDRVVKEKRQVKRNNPTFIGWKDSLILDRQMQEVSAGTMFQGRIARPLRYTDSDEESSFEEYTWNKVTTQDGSDVKSVNKNEKPYMIPLKIGQEVLKETRSVDNLGSNISNINPETQGQVPNDQDVDKESLVLKLEKSLAEYDKYQDKFMNFLVSAKDLIGNKCVALLESKFCKLNIKANDFVARELNQQVTGINLPEETEILKLKSPLDDDLCLTQEEWDIIDKCSVPRAKTPTNSAKLFSNMESQSKIFSLELENTGLDFKTPLGGRVFKVPLDPTIPSFDLNIDGDEDENLESNGIPCNQELGKNSNDNNNVLHRPRRETKISDKRRSPYLDRFTNIKGRFFKKEEIAFWNWLHSNSMNPNRILFKWKGVTCYKLDFQSLNVGEKVMTSIIDVWCCFLNSMEEFRSPTSPRRLFCYTETTLGTLLAIDEKTIQRKYEIFEENLDHIFRTYEAALSDVDMVFFPIHHIDHYYVVCYNMKNPSMDILDNMFSTKSTTQLYGQQLKVLHNHFVKYLELKKYGRTLEIMRLIPTRLQMAWQTRGNGIDCGVFAMRHLETYMGGGARNWDSKFVVEGYTQGKQLNKFRVLFAHRMISSPINGWYGVILDEIKDSRLIPDEAGIAGFDV